MLRTVDPKTRTRIAAALARAITGKKASALELLTPSDVGGKASAALAMAKARILYLDGETAGALEIFESGIEPFAVQESIEYRALVAGNKNTVRFAMLDVSAVEDHYKMQDLLRVAGAPHQAMPRVALADNAASRNEHYEALPLYWSDLIEAYENGAWIRLCAAHGRMARECCALGWFAEAIFHAVSSLDKDAATYVSEQLLHREDLADISAGIESLLRCAHLLEHRYIASIAVEILRDVIPDALFDDVFAWALEGAQRFPLSREMAVRVSASWRALSVLMFRSSREQAKAAVELALGHPLFNAFVLQRGGLINLVQAAFPKLDSSLMERIANSCLDLLGSRKHVVDYSDALNLAATIAKNAPAVVVEKFADALLPRGTPIADLKLTRLLPILGRQPSPEQLDRLVSSTARQLYKQVQRTEPGAEASYDLSYLMTMEQNQNGKKLRVFFGGGMVELDAAVALRKWLSAGQIRQLSEAALDMIGDASNLPGNKIGLIEALIHLSKTMDLEACQMVVDRLRVQVSGSTVPDWQAGGPEQLSPFKLEMDSPKDVSGHALYCLAVIAGDHPDGPFVGSVISLVESALAESDIRLRRAGIAASGKLPFLPKSLLTQVISCARDSDSKIASYAYAALCERSELLLDESQWEFLATDLRFSLTQRDAGLRRAAALCICRLERTELSADQLAVLSTLKEIVRSDIHFSVRQAFAAETRESAGCTDR